MERRIGLGMAERDAVRQSRAWCFDPLDAPAQGRKRAHACARHAPLPSNPMTPSWFF